MHGSSNPERLSIIQLCHRGSKNNISESHCQKEKEKEENATEITPFRASSSKSKNEWLNPAKGSLLYPEGKRETGLGDFPLALPFIQHTWVWDVTFLVLFLVTPGTCRKLHSSFANTFTNILKALNDAPYKYRNSLFYITSPYPWFTFILTIIIWGTERSITKSILQMIKIRSGKS